VYDVVVKKVHIRYPDEFLVSSAWGHSGRWAMAWAIHFPNIWTTTTLITLQAA